MRGEGHTPLGKKKGYYVMFDPIIVKVVDEIAKIKGLNRNEIFELALSKLFLETITEFEELSKEVSLNG